MKWTIESKKIQQIETDKNTTLPESKSYTSSTCFELLKVDDNGVVEDDGGLENLMLALRSGIEDAAAEDTSPIALLSFSSIDWGVTGRVGSFKEALADANTWAIRPLERAEEEAATEEDEEEEKDEDEEEEDVVHPSLAYIRSSLLTVGSMRVVNNEIVARRLAVLSSCCCCLSSLRASGLLIVYFKSPKQPPGFDTNA